MKTTALITVRVPFWARDGQRGRYSRRRGLSEVGSRRRRRVAGSAGKAKLDPKKLPDGSAVHRGRGGIRPPQAVYGSRGFFANAVMALGLGFFANADRWPRQTDQKQSAGLCHRIGNGTGVVCALDAQEPLSRGRQKQNYLGIITCKVRFT